MVCIRENCSGCGDISDCLVTIITVHWCGEGADRPSGPGDGDACRKKEARTADQQWCHLANGSVNTRTREKRQFVSCDGCRLTCQPSDVPFLLTTTSRRQKTPTDSIW